MDYSKIFSEFEKNRNAEQAKSMSAYMRNLFAYLGIPSPKRRELQKEFLKTAKKEVTGKQTADKQMESINNQTVNSQREGTNRKKAADKQTGTDGQQETANGIDWQFVFECWNKPEREYQYLALDYLTAVKAKLTPSDIPNLKKLIEIKSWWDSVDCLDSIVGDIALRHSEVNKTLLEWSTHPNFWLRRAAIDHQLGRKDKTDAPLLKKIIINNLGQTEFFINKAIGWSLREYSKTNPAWVRAFIAEYKDRLSPLSVREGSKYI